MQASLQETKKGASKLKHGVLPWEVELLIEGDNDQRWQGIKCIAGLTPPKIDLLQTELKRTICHSAKGAILCLEKPWLSSAVKYYTLRLLIEYLLIPYCRSCIFLLIEFHFFWSEGMTISSAYTAILSRTMKNAESNETRHISKIEPKRMTLHKY